MLAIVVAAGMVASAAAQDYVQDADEERVALDKVPAAVKAKADELSKGARFTQAFQDKSKNYRLVGKNAEGVLVVFQGTEEGRLLSLATRTPAAAKSVPRPVTKALDAERKKNATLRGFVAKSIEEADIFEASKGKLEHLFQFRGANGMGDPVVVDVTPEGQVRSAKVVAIHPDAGTGKGPEEKAEGKTSAIPPEIAEAIQGAVPGMRITGSKVEKTAGATTYVVTGRDENTGGTMSAEANANGMVTAVRHDLNPQNVPQQALEMVMQQAQDDPRLAGFRPQKAQRLELRQAGTTALAFQGKTTKGAGVEVRIGMESGELTVVPPAASAGDDAAADGKSAGKKTTRTKKSR
jgi:hypothetical protein